MIVATPVDYPKVEPDDWEIFWNIWNMYAKPLHKKFKNPFCNKNAPVGATDVWIGLDIYIKYNIPQPWQAPFYNIEDSLPKMYNSLLSIDDKIHRIRLIQSLQDIHPHTDDNRNQWNFRSFVFHQSTTPQWYFINPNDPDKSRTYLNMPADTNWFMYNDKHVHHGSDYDPLNKKIILQLYTTSTVSTDFLEHNIQKYKDFVIKF
jgi:hypothetical protein